MNIVLLGYRGSGKTSVGKRLASELWKKFVDTDAEICKRFDGLTIREIWERFGEGAFREMEVKVVAEVMGRDEQVVALGGGSPMQAGAFEAVKRAAGTVRIYLKCDAGVLAKRIAGDAATAAARPNLTGLGGGEAEVRAVLEKREPTYLALADKVLDVTHIESVDDVVGYVVRMCL
jgi:shikimate kinase